MLFEDQKNHSHLEYLTVNKLFVHHQVQLKELMVLVLVGKALSLELFQFYKVLDFCL